MKVTIIGTGYVWLTHGTCLAELENDVICVDIDINKIEQLKQWIIPIFEPKLSNLVIKNHRAWRLNFSTDVKSAIDVSDIIFIAVGTPPGPDGHADMQYVKQVAQDIWKYINKYTIIVTKSTVPVGTWDMITNIISAGIRYRWMQIDFDVASNPEFLREWTAVDDFKNSDRVVIWCNDENGKAVQMLKRLYSPLKNTEILVTDMYSAELIKYWANSLLAVQVSFINAISRLCEKLWADVNKVAKWLRLDWRIWHKAFLTAWPGFGGSCFPKDVMEFAQTFEDNWIPNGILQATLDINEQQKYAIFIKIKRLLDWNLEWKTVSILWLAFKSNTDDIRYSPSIVVINELLKKNAKIKCYDPKAMNNFKNMYPDLDYCDDMYIAVTDSDCMVVMTDWDEFKQPDWEKIISLMKRKNVVDARNIYDKSVLINMWFNYIGVWI